MARTVLQIQTDIDTVRAEMANASSHIRFSGGGTDRETTNRPTSQAIEALAALQMELDSAIATAGNTVRPRQIRLSGSSGFGTTYNGY